MGVVLLGAAGVIVLLLFIGKQNAQAQTSDAPFLDLSGGLEQLPVVGSYFVNMDGVFAVARAIAFAEGFYSPGSRASRNHNPGDLTLDIGGNDIHPLSFDGPYAIYQSDADGFADLQGQIILWLTGKSHVAGPSDTIATLSRKYTATEQAGWARNVASYLGVSVDTSLSELA
jgi:hypothetical protein